MYYISDQTIEVESSNGRRIIIERESKFYEYIKRIIDADKQLRRILMKVQDNSGVYKVEDYMEMYNSILGMGERTLNLIEARALIYEQLSTKHPEILEDIESDELDLRLNAQKMKDEIMLNGLDVFEIYASDPNTIISFARRDDAHVTLQDMENTTLQFIRELGIEKSSEERRNAEKRESEPITIQGKSPEDIATEVLEKHGVDPNSVFYLPLKQSVERGLTLEKAKAIAENKAQLDSAYVEVAEKIGRIINENNESIRAKHKHFTKYKDNPTETPPTLLDEHGNSYYDMILPLGAQSVRTAQILLEDIQNPDFLTSTENLKRLDDFVTRDNNFARTLGVRDSVDFDENPRQRRYTSKYGRIKEFYEKHKKGIAVSSATLGVALSLATGDLLGGATKLIDEIKNAVTDNQTKIVQKIETTRELEDIVAQPTVDPRPTEHISSTLSSFQVAKEETRKVGPLESLVDNLSEDEIELYVEALKRGNNSIPHYKGAYGIALDAQAHGTDEEFLREAFRVCDERISRVSEQGDSHQLAYQMMALADVLIKSEIEEALDEKGMDVDIEDVDIYAAYNTNDSVRAYDVRLKNPDGSITILSRADHLKGTRLDTLIRSKCILERAVKIVAPFDPNKMMADATQSCYQIIQEYISGDKDLKKRGKIQDIKKEKSKGFEEIDN